MSELSQARAEARELSQEQQLSIARNARLVERTRIRELIQARIDTLDRTRDRANWNDPFREGQRAGFRAALSSITSEGDEG